jgi:ribonuclease R
MSTPLERRTRVAVVSKRGRFAVCEPLFERGPQLPLAGGRRVGTGRMVLVEPGRRGAGVLRDLGSPTRAGDVVAALLWDRGVDRGFRPGLEREAEEAAATALRRSGRSRHDLTALPTLTVDPATAHDFDDAVSAIQTDEGIRLWIHIADVAAHVRPGTELDSEAYRRGNSTYVPGEVAPMLPQVLSSDACSLNPGRERLAVTVELDLSSAAEPLRVSIYRSLVRSDARLDYETLDEVFANRAAAPPAVAEPLALARRAAAALAERRRTASLEVEGGEPEFSFQDGDVVAGRSVPQTEAHRLIEHLMILTNEQVAELLERKRVPALYRVHEQPDPQRIAFLLEQLAALDVPTPPVPDHISPRQAGELAVKASRACAREAARRGHGREAYTTLVLRALRQAHYSDRNLGHAGLGSSAYAHFTSPIRRYPDLIAHRALLSVIGEDEEAPRAELVAEAGPYSSERERDAMRTERDADAVCATFLLQRELLELGPGASFEGEVVGVIGAGAFVRFGGRLGDVYEGFLPARLIGGRERFELDRTETMLVGSRGRGAVRLGDPMTVTVERTEAPRGRVDLAPVQAETR